MIWSAKKRRAEEKRLLAECERMAERLGAKAAPNGRRVQTSIGGTWLDVRFADQLQADIWTSHMFSKLGALTQLHNRLEFECSGLPGEREGK